MLRNVLRMALLVGLFGAAVSQAATVTLTVGDEGGYSSFNTAGNWSDGQAPSAGNDYVASVLYLRTPATYGSFTFEGDSLTLGNGTNQGAMMYKGLSTGEGGTITVNDLRLNRGTVQQGTINNFTLAGNITLLAGGGTFNMNAAARNIYVSAAIGGTGGLTVINGADAIGLRLEGVNTYSGSTTINSGGKITLSSTGSMLLDINDGSNSQILGGGVLDLDGKLRLDVAGVTAESSWTLLDVSTLTETYNTNFSIAIAGTTDKDFTENVGVWTLVDGSNRWTFTESTGVLALTTVPEPATLALCAFGGMALIMRKKRN